MIWRIYVSTALFAVICSALGALIGYLFGLRAGYNQFLRDYRGPKKGT